MRRMIAMREFGVEGSRAILDKQSGKDFQRPGYRRLVRRLKAGDTLVINLTGVLIADIVLQLLSCVAQAERENIRRRQMEGIAAAKTGGVRFGPEAQVPPEGFAALHQAWRAKRVTLREAAEACGMPKSTFYDAALRVERAAGGK